MFTKNQSLCQKQPIAVLCKKTVFKNVAIFKGKHLFWSLFLINLQDFRAATLLKKTPAQSFYCDYCEIFKTIYFEDYMRTAASLILQNSL